MKVIRKANEIQKTGAFDGLAKAGAATGLGIGFEILEDEANDQVGRLIKKARLREVSLPEGREKMTEQILFDPAEHLRRAIESDPDIELRATQMAAEIENRLDQRQQARQTNGHDHPPDRTWASELGHPCLRHLFYARTAWDQKKPVAVDLAYRLEEGNEKEDLAIRALTEAGFVIQDRQRYLQDDKLLISGRIDLIISRQGGSGQAPVEIKTIAPQFFDGIKTAQDLRTHRKFWIRKYASQLNFYLGSLGLPFGFFYLATWGRRPRILPFLFDADLYAADLARIEKLNEYIAKGETPPPIPYDNDACQLCPWAAICGNQPSVNLTELDPADAFNLEQMLELKETADRYEELKARLIGTGSKPGKYYGINAELGKIIIETRTQLRTYYNLPPDIKKTIEELQAPHAEKREIKITQVRWAGE